MASLKGQIAIVTGSSRGIGRAIARRLAAAECDLALLARSQEELQALAWEIKTAGREALAIPTDLRDAGQIEAGVGKALQYFGRIDILVNNAGLWHYAPIENLSVADWDEMFDVNLRAMFLCTKAVLPSMFERGRGHIVNVGSTSGIIAEDEGTGYCATKWGRAAFRRRCTRRSGHVGFA